MLEMLAVVPRRGLTCTGLSCRCGLVLGSSFLQDPSIPPLCLQGSGLCTCGYLLRGGNETGTAQPTKRSGEKPLTLSISLNTQETKPRRCQQLGLAFRALHVFPGAAERM